MKRIEYVCPRCKGRLVQNETGFRCEACSESYDDVEGIHRMITPDRRTEIAPFLLQYASVRHAEGRGAPTADYYLRLPDVPTREWRSRRRSAKAALRWFDEFRREYRGQIVTVLDVGAGNCWFTRMLIEHGFQAVALDIFDDALDGLRAGEHYTKTLGMAIPRVIAHFDQLPFPPQSFDVVLFNGSLHYSHDNLRTIREARRVLRDGGAIVVNDSPMYRSPRSGERMVQIVQSSLARLPGAKRVERWSSFLLTTDPARWQKELGARVERRRVWYGVMHEARRWKTRLVGRREPATMELIVIEP